MRKDKASITARKVALGVVTLSVKPEMAKVLPVGIVDATEKLLVAAGVVGEKTIRWARSQRVVSIYEAFDWMLPGQFEAFAYRKAFCEQHVRSAIEAGATQVLVLGAGYDTIGWRLAPEFPAVNFFEIDHPSTARLKAKGVAKMGARDNLYLIAEDLSQRQLADVLKGNESWEAGAQTAIIAEGLVMYLTPEAVQSLFQQCASMVGTDSRITFSYIPAGADGKLDAGRWTELMLWLQKRVGEPWFWSIRPDDIDSFLKEFGWRHDPAAAGSTAKHGVEFFITAFKQQNTDG
ncbi:class I SAM-dependent methyltransferase [Pseudomonadota bacterium]